MDAPVVANLIEQQARTVRERLYAHQDYFSYIIPSTWFLLGAAALVGVFYRSPAIRLVSEISKYLHELGEPSTAVDLLGAVMLTVAAFNITLVVGHVLNGFAAGVLERVLVRKLLKYPFELYELKWADTESGRSDGERFRDAVLDVPYRTHCANLFPVIFFEVTLWTFANVNGHAGSWVDKHKYAAFGMSLLITLAHFGVPYWVPGSRHAKKHVNGSRAFKRLFWAHIVVVLGATVLVWFGIAIRGNAGVLFILPLVNWLLASIDSRLRKRGKGKHKRVFARQMYFYLTLTFPNYAYFGARLVGYATAPSRKLIGTVKASVSLNSGNDFFWMTHLRVQHDSPQFYETAYHAMSLHSMNRNLSNATAFVVVLSVVCFVFKWPEPFRYAALAWVAALSLLSYLFFVRYLFLFSGRYSRFLMRAAALLAERDRPKLITTSEASVGEAAPNAY